jgi:hypothetical protein
MGINELSKLLEAHTSDSYFSTTAKVIFEDKYLIEYEVTLALQKGPAMVIVLKVKIEIDKLIREITENLELDMNALSVKEGLHGLLTLQTHSVLNLLSDFTNQPTNYKKLADLFKESRGVVKGAKFGF